LSAAGSAQAPPAPNWPQFRGTARLTGVSTSTLPATLKVLWTYETGDAIDSSAAVVDGSVYVGSATGDLTALDLASGKVRWKYATNSSIVESSPAVTRDAVFVGDADGVLHAVNVRDGKPLWTFKTTQEIKSSPVVVDTTVLIGSYDGRRYILETATGKVRWKT